MSTQINSQVLGLSSNVKDRFNSITGQIGVLELKAKRDLEGLKQEMTIFATSEDLGRAFKMIK